MNVTIIERGGKNDFSHLYLSSKGKRKSLDLKVFKKPKNAQQREHNKKMYLLAEHIKTTEEKNLYMYGYAYLDLDRKNKNFLDVADQIHQEKKGSNKAVFFSAIKMLVDFHKSTDLKVIDVDHSFLNAFKEYLLKETSQNTASSYFNKIGEVLKRALKEQYIFTNPMDRVDKIPQIKTKKEYLSLSEIRKINAINIKDTLLKRTFICACFIGLRFSDITTIQWKNISSDYTLTFRPQKTPEKLISIKLHPTAIELMGKRGGDTQRIFPLSYSNISEKLQAWMKLAGIDKKITFHNSRHTFGSLGLKYSKDIYAVKEALGHSKIQTTEIYAHLSKQQVDTVINSIPTL